MTEPEAIRRHSLCCRFVIAALLATPFSVLHGPTPAAADIKDYEIIRFLYLKTPCGRSTIVKAEKLEAELRFVAECQNKTTFPDGAIVTCSDPHDDRSCQLKTPGTEFHDLRLLQRE